LVEELTDEVAPIAAGLESVPTHSDRPARHDELGRARLAEVLAERTRRVRGEDTQMRVRVAKDRRAKLRRDRQAARQAGCFMIHIHAPWGAGKSSLLNFYARDLRNRSADSRQGAIVKGISFMFGSRRARDPQLSQWIVVEFSAWAHQRLEPPWWWLLAAIRRSAVRELWLIDRSRWLRFLIRDGLWRLWNSRVIVLSVLIALAALAVAAASDWFGLEGQSLSALKASALSVAALLAVGSTLSMHIRGTSRALAFGSAEGAVRFLKRTHDPLGAYQRRFRWLVRSADRPLAVFIDDLDRCKPEYVVALLEGIQTLFAGEPVTYVVAADRTWLCDSFAKSYADFEASVGDAGRPLGYLFLEKTFQISMEIPPLSFESRRQYWRLLTRAVDAVDRLSIAPTVQRADDDFADARTNEEIERRLNELLPGSVNTEEILQAAVRRLNAPELQAQLEDLLRQFAPLLENNPRSMKRLINAYGIERDRLLREQRLPSPEERKQLILFTILRLRWPRFAEFLLKRSHEVERFNNLDNLPDDHPFAAVFMDPEVRALFDCSFVDVRLDRELLDRYAGRETAQSTSVGA
jgi:hypothetical protein